MVIIYTSNTGFTAQYAKLLGEQTNFPVYTLDEGFKTLEKGTEAIYLGWVMGGHISALGRANGHFAIRAAAGVGMSPPSQGVLNTLGKMNYLSAPIFYLPGGYAPEKLKGIKRTMLNLVLKSMRQKLAAKKERTEADFAQLELMTKGGSHVDAARLAPLVAFIEKLQA